MIFIITCVGRSTGSYADLREQGVLQSEKLANNRNNHSLLGEDVNLQQLMNLLIVSRAPLLSFPYISLHFDVKLLFKTMYKQITFCRARFLRVCYNNQYSQPKEPRYISITRRRHGDKRLHTFNFDTRQN